MLLQTKKNIKYINNDIININSINNNNNNNNK